jgi:hypothetical protein
MTTYSIKTICPICQNGEIEISLDDFIKILNLLLYEKYPYSEQGKEYNEENSYFCKTHKDKKVIKYCNQCCIDLCQDCLTELHDINFPYHTLVNIFDKKGNNKNNNLSFDNIKNIKEINELQKKEKNFLEKLENESIILQTKINKIIKDLKSFMQNYMNKLNLFQNIMEKIFQIINLVYYNYYTSNNTDKKEIIISKKLTDFNFLSKKIDLNEINIPLQKIIKDNTFEETYFNFELQWIGDKYKKNSN